MGLHAEKPPFVERRVRGRPRRRADLAKHIQATILAMGGEAHRRLVIEHLAREFGMDPRHVPPDFEAQVLRAFQATLEEEEQRLALGFHLPFGPGSHRWGVKLAIMEIVN
jgi:transcriptional regulator GlxA family with amidase domain